MNANRQLDEDDLVLYAMRLLAEPEHAEIAAVVAADPAARQRVLELRSTLAAYADAVVEPQPLPAGSLDRLLARIQSEPKALEVPAPLDLQASQASLDVQAPLTAQAALDLTTPSTSVQASKPGPALVAPRSRPSSSLGVATGAGWATGLGWAIAALLAVGVGLSLKQSASLRDAVTSRETKLAALSSDAETLRRERDALRSNISSQEQKLATSSTELAATQNQAAALKNEAENARSSAANLKADLSGEKARASAEQARAAAAEQERNRLAGTLAAQADQLAALQSSTSNAEVLATLTDPTALRVVLTKPKSKPAPVGRAAYIASKGSLVFLGSNLEQPKANKVYELWLLPADGSSPIAAGTFLPDAQGNAHLVYNRFPRAVAAKGFAITFENPGGANTPSLPLILAGS